MSIAIRKAVDLVGGNSKLSKLLSVRPPTVSQWISGVRQVPIERCIQIEDVTKGQVRCEDLRPDINWAVLRQTPQDKAA